MSPQPAFGTADTRIEVPRHGGNGNPLILLPEYAPDPELAAILRKPYKQRTAAEGRAIKDKYAYYSRASSAGKAIDDTTALTKWKLRQVIIGLASNRHLLLNAQAHAVDSDDNKHILNDIAEQAMEAAKSSSAASTGTALHKLAEYADAGVDIPGLDDTARRDIDAYKACMVRYGVTMHRAERFVVCDELRVAGTFDREMSVAVAPGVSFVGDVKTGNTSKNRDGEVERDEAGRIRLAYVTSMAVQLGVYANSSLYDPLTGARTPLEVDKTSAIVIHLPQGLGECELHWLNIAEGWKAAHLAADARNWQNRRDLTVPLGGAA